MTHATVRAAFPGKFSRKRTLAAAALSGYAQCEGAWRWQDMVFGAYSMGGCTALGSAMLCRFAVLPFCRLLLKALV